MTTIKIALLGFGTVAQGTFNLLQDNAELIRNRTGVNVEISKIIVRNPDKYSHITLPETAQYVTDIDEVLKRVCLIYDNKENMIEYQMVFNYKEQSHGYDIEDKKIKEEKIKISGNNIDIFQYELPDGNKENVAQFTYEDVFYTINTTMDEGKLKKLLKNLYFF